MQKPSVPQGTRDFAPAVVRKRQYIFNTLKTMFERYGFQPIETPAMENLETLMGKYGEEGDRLIFKILNNGLHEKKDKARNTLMEEWEKVTSRSYSSTAVTERALRYDLTIPFARFVVMNQNDIAFPFRRYQMQPVWRADKPQSSRYREFWQCDADIVGSNSLINEAELLHIYCGAFDQLKVPVAVKVNSRKMLAGLAELCGAPEKMMEITIALDKLDKIGWTGVEKELTERGIEETGRNTIHRIIQTTGTNAEKLVAFGEIMQASEIGKAGVEEIKKTLDYYAALGGNTEHQLKVDISLARGLNYYTGIIVEVVCTDPNGAVGSIGGGGRYDDLTGLFGLKGISGVGISFGVDRIYDVLQKLDLFPAHLDSGAKIFILNLGGENEIYGLSLLRKIREAGLNAEMYADAAKFDKQMKYANKRGFAYVIIPGDSEREQNKVSLKFFLTGQQQLVGIDECVNVLKIAEQNNMNA